MLFGDAKYIVYIVLCNKASLHLEHFYKTLQLLKILWIRNLGSVSGYFIFAFHRRLMSDIGCSYSILRLDWNWKAYFNVAHLHTWQSFGNSSEGASGPHYVDHFIKLLEYSHSLAF